MANNNKSPDLIAYAVTGTDDSPFYNKIGAAWKNKKGGYGIKLSALPINGELVLFPPKDDTDK